MLSCEDACDMNDECVGIYFGRSLSLSLGIYYVETASQRRAQFGTPRAGCQATRSWHRSWAGDVYNALRRSNV
jgi:hypothetical protein